MPRYNLAYSPSDKTFAETCVAFAATHFGALADGYCLNAVNALPHITLSQFEAEEAQLDHLWRQAKELCRGPFGISFYCVDLRPGAGVHAGYIWAELLVRRAPELIASQKKIADMLAAAGIEPLTQSGDEYHPHLTFARLAKVPKDGAPPWPDKAALKHPHEFHLTLGLSNANGVYLQTLQPR